MLAHLPKIYKVVVVVGHVKRSYDATENNVKNPNEMQMHNFPCIMCQILKTKYFLHQNTDKPCMQLVKMPT